MKKIALLLMLLPMLASAHVSGNAYQKESIYGEWRLVGWNDGGNWFEADNNYVGYHRLSVEIPKEGYMMAYSMVNEIFVGQLTLHGNEMIFDGEARHLMTEVYCDITENLFFEDHICDIKFYQLDGNLLRLYYTDNDYFVFTSVINDSEGQTEDYYRPFIEEDKVWKVGYGNRNPIQFVEYYYFDGDTIIDGRTCKQMMCQRYVTPDYSDYEVIMRYPLLRRSGVWYEEDKKVYEYNTTDKQFKLMYDFSVDDNATLQIHGQSYVVGPKLTEGLKGFKGVYRNVMWPSWDGEQIYDEGHHNTTWLEGVGSIEGPGYNVYLGKEYHGGAFLMSCTVGDEVIYYNDEYEDGATPEVTGSRKNRFDFSHTVKTKPKSRTTRGAEPSLYGEYNDQQLGINLNPLYDAYLVSITDETGKTVYEKNINAGAIVGLNIDISAYPEGRYTVTVENNNESFTGQFDAQTVGLSDAVRLNNNGEMINDNIFDLQGRQLQGKPQRGLYIQNGKKVMVK